MVPPEVAGSVLHLVEKGLRELVHRDGGAVSPSLLRVMFALHEAAERQEEADAPSPTSNLGTASAGYVSVRDAADVLGCSGSWVRRLTRRGHLLGHRVGWAWLIDRASLDDYRLGGRRA